MSITLTDTLANVFTLPANFKISGYSWKKKTRLIQIAFKDGGDETGDKKLDTRQIDIEGILIDNATYLATQTTMNSWLYKNDLKLSISAGYYINVKAITGVSFMFLDGGFERVAKVKFSCICPDPFFYATALTSSVTVVVGTPTAIPINNASLFDIYPNIQIVNSANNHSLVITNSTDDSNFLSFIDPNFDNAETLLVDNKIGTVTEEGINAIQFMAGNFLRLLPGANALVYTGSNCTITITYYAKYL